MSDNVAETVDALKMDETFESLSFGEKVSRLSDLCNRKLDLRLGGQEDIRDVKRELRNFYVSLFLRLSFLEDEVEEYFSEYGTPRDVIKMIDALDLIVDDLEDFESAPKFITRKDGIVLLSYGDAGLGLYKERFVPYWLLFAEEDEIRTYLHWRANLLEASIIFEKSVEIDEDFLNAGRPESLFDLKRRVEELEDAARRELGNSENVGAVDINERVFEEILANFSSRYSVSHRSRLLTESDSKMRTKEQMSFELKYLRRKNEKLESRLAELESRSE